MFGQRQGIIIWMHSLKNVKMLRRFGNIHHVSKRLKYVVLYCGMESVDQTIEKLSTYSFIKHVEPSYKPYIKLEFESKIDKAKEYDYKMGL
ncbi:YlbG family protein [Metabacillus arenae]|uniref:UPF0298 protein IC621_12040 n=1 Tax=Metabacillus arenae TaxID=2771434 RepID=A0A926NG65_9BACI|nr:YlbG family protein [Metabacillus arenae]MBD1380964.1 YlbG family protein [Metabacillus arenae]